MAATSHQYTKSKGGDDLQSYKIAASKAIYAGTMVFLASGYATDVVNSGANVFAGVACEDVDNSSGSAGDLGVKVRRNGRYLLTGSSFTQGTVGSVMYASDNATITTTSTNMTKIGRCVEYYSTTQVWVEIDTVQA